MVEESSNCCKRMEGPGRRFPQTAGCKARACFIEYATAEHFAYDFMKGVSCA